MLKAKTHTKKQRSNFWRAQNVIFWMNCAKLYEPNPGEPSGDPPGEPSKVTRDMIQIGFNALNCFDGDSKENMARLVERTGLTDTGSLRIAVLQDSEIGNFGPVDMVRIIKSCPTDFFTKKVSTRAFGHGTPKLYHDDIDVGLMNKLFSK